MTFVQKICTFNINEIDYRCQFHQHFTGTFCANIFSPKLQSWKVTWESCAQHFHTKHAHKMLMKLTTGVNFINILRMHFAPIFWRQKNFKAEYNKRKLHNALSYKSVRIKCWWNWLKVDVDVARPIAQKTMVWEVLGSIPCSADGFSLENLWRWLFLEINISSLSGNGYKCIWTYNKKCYLIYL